MTKIKEFSLTLSLMINLALIDYIYRPAVYLAAIAIVIILVRFISILKERNSEILILMTRMSETDKQLNDINFKCFSILKDYASETQENFNNLIKDVAAEKEKHSQDQKLN